MHIREAMPEDNGELLSLQARCPQGSTLVVSAVNAPDFFARARAYEAHRVFVACDGDRIVGSVACALRDGLVGGSLHRLGYGFQAFVAPEHRRNGVAGALYQRWENHAAEGGAALLYALVLEGNRPSMGFLEGKGFRRRRSLAMAGLAVYREMEVLPRGEIRPMEPGDLAAVARLLNETWRGFDLYRPASAEALARFVARTPGYDPEDLLLLERRGRISAALGLWDWSRTARITVEALGPKMRALGLLLDVARRFHPMPRGPRPGDVLRQAVLTPIAFGDPGDLAALLRHASNRALARGLEQLFCVCERDHPLLGATKGFIRVDTTLHLYARPLRGDLSMGDRPVFVDGVDL